MRLEPSSPRPRPLAPSARPERDFSRPLPSALGWSVLVGFIAVLALAVVVFDLPWWLPGWYAALSLAAFVAYGTDKAAARRDGPRVSERTLLTLGILGGWPGALAAQQVFRHKTRKRSFRRAYWSTVVVNLLVLVALVTALLAGVALPTGSSAMLQY